MVGSSSGVSGDAMKAVGGEVEDGVVADIEFLIVGV